jgi:peptide chain release factor 2
MRERTRLETRIGKLDALDGAFAEHVEMLELAEAEGDEGLVAEAEAALTALRETAGRAELQTLLSGEADGNDCFLEVHAGAGGTEAQDWAEMLARMYVRWAERRGYKVEWIEESPGEEAGIKSTTLKIIGEDAYGWLKTETGVHRLVRISPFDAGARRHTSFASVGAYPVIDDTIDIEILDKDLRIDTYRASGAGGQHVNRTDSAVRITHLPTGIVVQCQTDRSQHRNRAAAMQMLKARIYEMEMRRREEETRSEHEAKAEIGWGRQIRSYVLQPSDGQGPALGRGDLQHTRRARRRPRRLHDRRPRRRDPEDRVAVTHQPAAGSSSSDSSEALPPEAVVSTQSVRSWAKRPR